VKRARFVAEARQEFLAEVAYYNKAQPGLGDRFTKAVEEATSQSVDFSAIGDTVSFEYEARFSQRVSFPAFLPTRGRRHSRFCNFT